MPRRRRQIVTRIGITRRLQALRALGWSTSQIATITGLYTATVTRITNDPHVRITEPTMRRVVAGYARTETRLPPARDARERQQVAALRNGAQERGWAPPHAWDNIDDPDEQPKGVRTSSTVFVVGVDEAVLLLQLGVHPSEVARRLGVKRESLARRLRRAKQHKWAAAVERKDG